eukprot:4602801-Amphidinium_carterae.1
MLPHVHALRDHPYVIGGDWNFEPDEFPIPLARGDTVGCQTSVGQPAHFPVHQGGGGQANRLVSDLSPHARLGRSRVALGVPTGPLCRRSHLDSQL